jgi:hypothetical protein
MREVGEGDTRAGRIQELSSSPPPHGTTKEGLTPIKRKAVVSYEGM